MPPKDPKKSDPKAFLLRQALRQRGVKVKDSEGG